MAKTVFGAYRGNVAGPFPTPSPGFFLLGGPQQTNANESFKQFPIRIAGSFERLAGYFDNVATSRTFGVRKNSADTTLTLTPGDTFSGPFQNSNSPIHFSVGDLFGLKEAFVGATGFSSFACSLSFNADVGTVGIVCGGATSIGVSTTISTAPYSGTFSPTNVLSRNLIRAPFTCKNLGGLVSANTLSSTVVLNALKNGVAGVGSVSVGAGATGFFEDTTNSDSFASGDTFAFQWTSGAGGTSASLQSVAHFVYDSVRSEVFGGGGNVWNFNAAAQFISILGFTSTAVTAENQAQNAMQVAGFLSNMRFNVASNTMTGTWTQVLRKNGANGNQTISVGAATTGSFEDAIQIDQVLETDSVAISGSGGVSGSISNSLNTMTMTPVTTQLRQALFNRVAPPYFGRSEAIQGYNASLYPNPIPFGPYDYSSRPHPVMLRIDDLTTQQLNPNLYQNPIPFAQFDWNRPLGIAPPPPQSLPFNLSLSFVQAPFALYDWNTVAPPRLATPLTLPLNLNLFTNPIPFGPYDYSRAPTRVPQAQRDLSQSLNPLMFTNPIPFSQLDWSKPVRIGPVRRDMSLPKNLSLTGGGVVTIEIHANHFFVTMGMRPL